MSAVGDVLAAIAPVLDAHSEGWFVFGAQAIAVRGAPRATQDVDITVHVERSVLSALIEALMARGLTHRFPEAAERLLAAGAVLPFSHPNGMEIDLVIAGSGLEALALARAERLPIDGVPVPVASATDLVVMKMLAGRGKDVDDVRALLAGGEVDVDEVTDLLDQLEQALGQSDLLGPFRSLVSGVSPPRSG